MEKILPIIPVSDLWNKQPKIFSRLSDSPILLTQRGRAAGVLVHPDHWNEIIELLEDMEDGRIAEARLRDEENIRPFEEFAAELETEGSMSLS